MSQREPTAPYVYQPDPAKSLNDRAWAISGPGAADYEGKRFTKAEAEEELSRLMSRLCGNLVAMASVTPPCRACGLSEKVICFPDNHALAICPDCCDKTAEHPDGENGHQWEYDKWDGWQCRYCGIPRNCTEYEEAYIDRG